MKPPKDPIWANLQAAQNTYGASLQAQQASQQSLYNLGAQNVSQLVGQTLWGQQNAAYGLGQVVSAQVWPAPLKPEVTKYRGSRYATAGCHPVWSTAPKGYRSGR